MRLLFVDIVVKVLRNKSSPQHQSWLPLGYRSGGRHTWPRPPHCNTPQGSCSYVHVPSLPSWLVPGEQWNVPVCMCGMKKKEEGRKKGREEEEEGIGRGS